MRFAICSLALLAACGGGADQPAEEPTTEARENTESPEQKCVVEANADATVPNDAPTRISVKHIVVKHADVDRATDAITRTKGAACLRALEALDKMKAGADFATLVADYSDEEGAATREGSLGEIKPGDVAPSFAAAAFALDVGQVSYVVESKFGFHIILRTD